MANSIIQRITSGSLVLQIGVGIIAGIVLSLVSPQAGTAAMLLGNLFVQALKAVAPVLVLVLVASAIANRRASHTSANTRYVSARYGRRCVAGGHHE